jgi:dimethylargininase
MGLTEKVGWRILPPVTFRSAIVRAPAESFARGLNTGRLGAPDLDLARAQHRAYRRALERCGLRVIELEPDPDHPDSTFVEDTAVIAPEGAILARPGAPSRQGEVDAIRPALQAVTPRLRAIEAPGTLDGGDVCEAGGHVFIGVSGRTNEAGARQLAAFLAADGCDSTWVDLRGLPALLHLKSGLAWLGGRRLLAVAELAGHPAFDAYEVLTVQPEESHGANCVLVNGQVLVPAGCPRLEATLRELGYALLRLDVSEFRKMDGGLSCLSLRLS